MNINLVNPFIRGEGASYDYLGTPQKTNFFGQSNWWTVPTSWCVWQVGEQMFASPNANRVPQYALKLNLDGGLVFQSEAAEMFGRVPK
jgi:hypothetical protein